MKKPNPIVIAVHIITIICLYSSVTLSGVNRDSLEGIGLSVAQIYDGNRIDNKGRILILDVFENGPGYKAGLHKGDIITHIDGRVTKGRDLQKDIMSLLGGKFGTTVELKIYRISPERLFNVYVMRGKLSS